MAARKRTNKRMRKPIKINLWKRYAVEELVAGTFSMFGERKIRDTLAELTTERLLLSRPNRDYKPDHANQYCLNTPQVQGEINAWLVGHQAQKNQLAWRTGKSKKSVTLTPDFLPDSDLSGLQHCRAGCNIAGPSDKAGCNIAGPSDSDSDSDTGKLKKGGCNIAGAIYTESITTNTDNYLATPIAQGDGVADVTLDSDVIRAQEIDLAWTPVKRFKPSINVGAGVKAHVTKLIKAAHPDGLDATGWESLLRTWLIETPGDPRQWEGELDKAQLRIIELIRRDPRLNKKSSPTIQVPRADFDRMVHSIAAAFGWNPSQMTTSERGITYKAARELCLADVEPGRVQALYDFTVGNLSPGTKFLPMALANHVSSARAAGIILDRKPTAQERIDSDEETPDEIEARVKALRPEGEIPNLRPWIKPPPYHNRPEAEKVSGQ